MSPALGPANVVYYGSNHGSHDLWIPKPGTTTMIGGQRWRGEGAHYGYMGQQVLHVGEYNLTWM